MQGETRYLLFVGDDWAEDHHDVEIQDEAGGKLAARRLPEGAAGIARLHELIAAHLDGDGDPGQVVVAIETDRGLWVQALAAAGYQVYGLNPGRSHGSRSATACRGPRATPLTRTPWPIWSARSGTSCGPWPLTPPGPRRSRWLPARIRR